MTGVPWRTGWRYRERGYRHIYWDAGTMLGQLLAVADSAGWLRVFDPTTGETRGQPFVVGAAARLCLLADGRTLVVGTGLSVVMMGVAFGLGHLALGFALLSEEQLSAHAGDEVFEFPSASKPGVVYHVQLTNGVAVCDCPGFTYGGNCKHSREVIRRGS